MPSESKISVVISGPTNRNIERVIDLVLKLFPTDDLIISTNDDCYRNPNTKVLINPPQPQLPAAWNNFNNYLHNIQVGLQAAKYDRVFRLRSDMEIYGWPTELETHDYGRDPAMLAFKDFVICPSTYTIDPHCRGIYMCDFAHLGRKDDLLNLFSIPQDIVDKSIIGPEELLGRYYCYTKKFDDNRYALHYNQFTPEDLNKQAALFFSNFIPVDIKFKLNRNNNSPEVGSMLSFSKWLSYVNK